MTRRLLAGALCLAVLAACGTDAPVESENYGNLLDSPGTCSITASIQCNGNGDCPSGEMCNGLILVQEEHPTGWGRPDCFACHQMQNIHIVNRTGLPDAVVDLAGVRAIVQSQGAASCPLCHGTNGVQP